MVLVYDQGRTLFGWFLSIVKGESDLAGSHLFLKKEGLWMVLVYSRQSAIHVGGHVDNLVDPLVADQILIDEDLQTTALSQVAAEKGCDFDGSRSF
jgi:hypothetical protein